MPLNLTACTFSAWIAVIFDIQHGLAAKKFDPCMMVRQYVVA